MDSEAKPMPDADAAALDTESLRRADELRRQGAVQAAIDLGERVVARAQGRGDGRTVALAQIALANFNRYVPNSLTAIHLLNAAEGYCRTIDDGLLARVLTFKGMVLSDLGDHAPAIDLFREALGVIDRHRDTADPVLEATCQGAIGVACTQLNEFAQAEDAYRRSLDINRAQRNAEGMGYVYNNLAILRVRSIQARGGATGNGADGDRLAAELFEFLDAGMELNDRSVQSPHLRTLLLGTRGDGLRALGRAEEALPILELALDAYRGMGLPRGEADTSADLGAALLGLGRCADALEQLGAGLAAALAHDLKDHERRLRRLLSEAHERLGDFARALAEYKTYHRLERELSDRDTQKKLQQLALREEIEKALAAARAQQARSAELSRQNDALREQTAALDRLAYVDTLTGLANRRRFEETVAAMDGAPPASFAVAVLDIDFFKRINDTWSHAMGDAVLQAVGQILQAECRDRDLVARIGGEEFVLTLNGVLASQATDACERVRAAVERHDWARLQEGMAVTISIGVAPGDGTTAFGDLLKRADRHLYAAKHAGRNRVVAHEAPAAPVA